MRVLLVSTYELGHQPLHVASPAAALRAAGHDVACLDLSVQQFDGALLDAADAVGFSVPMHTAMRLALPVADAVRRARPDVPICFYGLYAPLSRDLTVRSSSDWIVAGEYERGLVAWADAVARGGHAQDVAVVSLARGGFHVPARDLLPPLERYAHLAVDDETRQVGYVEASHGCLHECTHCPLPTVYAGRARVVERDVVLSDIAQLVALGARHITFGDPDFLNAPTHSRRIVAALHGRFPDVTFDATCKVEHVLRHRDLWGELAEAGCLFVVTALETVNDDLLVRLDKGHTSADAVEALRVLRSHGIEPRPSWMPFTPWTTPRDVLDILDFVAVHDLVGNVDPVQYTIRLLLPEGSLLLRDPAIAPHLGPYDPRALTYTWTAADPRVDALQERLARIVEDGVERDEPAGATYLRLYREVAEAADVPVRDPIAVGSTEGRPRLTEPWFC